MIYQKFLVLFFFSYYFIIFLVGVYMKFCACRMYCKYVISIINKAVTKRRALYVSDELLENELYESYLKLEKLLKLES